MSRACFSVLFLVFSIAVKFGDCENSTTENKELNPNCEREIEYGVDGCTVSLFEHVLKFLGYFTGTDNVLTRKEIFQTCAVADLEPCFCGNEIDACGRELDMCRSNILAGQIKENLINNGYFNRSSCYCDDKFYYCLKNVTGPSKKCSNFLGTVYFHNLETECFKCVCPTDGCNPERDGDECEGHCKKYTWVSVKKYSARDDYYEDPNEDSNEIHTRLAE